MAVLTYTTVGTKPNFTIETGTTQIVIECWGAGGAGGGGATPNGGSGGGGGA